MSFEENLKRPSADLAAAATAPPPEPSAALPLLGTRSAAQQQRLLSVLLAIALLVLAGLVAVPLAQAGLGTGTLAAIGALACMALMAAAGLVSVQRQGTAQRQAIADQHRQQAQRQQQAASLANQAHHTAAKRLVDLVDELQNVVANDLTQRSPAAHDTSEAARTVQDMAARIHDVSARAQDAAEVARQSLQQADSGLAAVQDAIGGMDAIRDQIQDTAKCIKRLGESSQEIGETIELVAGITEQTNVLALNAAIQAASAGEAGRGFSVVAQEVQRLAQRSASATQQIAALVRAIQADAQDAGAAMERSTQGVVTGARLADAAGTALAEIDQVARRLADLTAQIAGAASQEAERANGVAGGIQQIFTVAGQAGDSTQATARQLRELARMAQDLLQSIARSKVA